VDGLTEEGRWGLYEAAFNAEHMFQDSQRCFTCGREAHGPRSGWQGHDFKLRPVKGTSREDADQSAGNRAYEAFRALNRDYPT
jgi:hypothetical protein